MTEMFTDDFKKHVAIIEKLKDYFAAQPDTIIQCLDIILKWCYIKITQSANTTLALKAFELIQMIFNHLEQIQYELMDHEAFVIIPFLSEKSGAYQQ